MEFARELAGLGWRLISTGGTARALEQAGVPVQKVEDLTGFPEIMDGRVKTLHPKVHAGILARLPLDEAQLDQLGIEPIDLVVVNLYPFRETIARSDVTLEQAIEQIDIGGPSMLRAAAKNFARVTVVVNPERYPDLIRELREQGDTSPATRLQLAREAFWHTAVYDAAIANYLYGFDPDDTGADSSMLLRRCNSFPPGWRCLWSSWPVCATGRTRTSRLPFTGKRPVYLRPGGCPPAPGDRTFLQQHPRSGCCPEHSSEFQATAAVVIKHNKPSGVACAPTLAEAFRVARDADAVAAYGGIMGLNQTVDLATAEVIRETFFEAVIAPAFSEEALSVLGGKQKLRLLATGERGLQQELDFKRVSGGFLLQEPDPLWILNRSGNPAGWSPGGNLTQTSGTTSCLPGRLPSTRSPTGSSSLAGYMTGAPPWASARDR